MTQLNKRDFSLSDIVVYNGIITQFGIIYGMVNWDDPKLELRLANQEERNRYMLKQ